MFCSLAPSCSSMVQLQAQIGQHVYGIWYHSGTTQRTKVPFPHNKTTPTAKDHIFDLIR